MKFFLLAIFVAAVTAASPRPASDKPEDSKPQGDKTCEDMLAEMYKYQQQMNGQMGQYGLQTGTGSIQYPTFGFDYDKIQTGMNGAVSGAQSQYGGSLPVVGYKPPALTVSGGGANSGQYINGGGSGSSNGDSTQESSSGSSGSSSGSILGGSSGNKPGYFTLGK